MNGTLQALPPTQGLDAPQNPNNFTTLKPAPLLEKNLPSQQPPPANTNIITLRPQQGPQEEFLTRSEDEVLFGGSKGGGKSFALFLAALRQIHKKGYKAIIFRRTYPKLSELIERAHQFFPYLGGKWMAKDYKWVFPAGSSIKFAHCQNEEDKYIYQGHEYHFMGFDQLEEFTESMYFFLMAQVRNPPPGVDKEIRATANPGGIGHAWVFRRFMVSPHTNDELPPCTTIIDTYSIPKAFGSFAVGHNLQRSRIFIPSTVYDNKILLENDPGYLTNLMQLPEAERKALLEGDWHVFAGQYFKEWSDTRHIIDAFAIPPNWMRYFALDFGSTAPCSAHWYAVDEFGNVYCYKEYYVAGATARQHAKGILKLMDKGELEQLSFLTADPAIFSKTGQDYSIAEVMMEEGLTGLEPGSNARVAGWQELKSRLYFNDASGQTPRIYFFRNCINATRTIPGLIHDPLHPEDLNSDGEDHAADDCRYGLARLRDSKAKEIDTSRQNASGFKFGLPVTKWREATEFGGQRHPYQD